MGRGRLKLALNKIVNKISRGAESSSPLSLREETLLKALVERYMAEGQPVGSKTLSQDPSIPLSSATIRNLLGLLEDKGLIASPHTSAGRLPTPQGLRFFIDRLLTVKPLATNQIATLRTAFITEQPREELLHSASDLLSKLSSLVGIVSTPTAHQYILRRVEFLSLSENRVLVILVVNEQEVQNRIIQADKNYSAGELGQAANYLNSIFAGHDLLDIRSKLLEKMCDDKDQLNQLMQGAIEMASQAFNEPSNKKDYVLAGASNLLAFAETAQSHRLQQLFKAFTEKRELLHLMDLCVNAKGVQIFIGEDEGMDLLQGCSLVTSPYQVDGQVVGMLGVIGPARMPYDRVIPLVEVTAKLLSVALKRS